MDYIFEKPCNPIGKAQKVEKIEQILQSLQSQWDEKIINKKVPWYKRWWRKANLFIVTKFLLVALDEFIFVIDELLEYGPDKKATVLAAIERLYDYVIREALPIWLRPIASKVKSLIVDYIIVVVIDWIVEKYRNGEWRDKLKDSDYTPPPQPDPPEIEDVSLDEAKENQGGEDEEEGNK